MARRQRSWITLPRAVSTGALERCDLDAGVGHHEAQAPQLLKVGAEAVGQGQGQAMPQQMH